MAVDYDGGPAFPLQLSDEHGTFHHGMSLRDYFAGQAMTQTLDRQGGDDWSVDAIASDSYRMADAMLKAREA